MTRTRPGAPGGADQLHDHVVGHRRVQLHAGHRGEQRHHARRQVGHAHEQEAAPVRAEGAAVFGFDLGDLGVHAATHEVAHHRLAQAARHREVEHVGRGVARRGRVEPLGREPHDELAERQLTRALVGRAEVVGVEHDVAAFAGDELAVVAEGRAVVAPLHVVLAAAGEGQAPAQAHRARRPIEQVRGRHVEGHEELQGRDGRAHLGDPERRQEVVHGLLVREHAEESHHLVDGGEEEGPLASQGHAARIRGEPWHAKTGLAEGYVLEHRFSERIS